MPRAYKEWLGYAEKRVPALYDDIRTGKVRLVLDQDREQTARQAQTPALFDFARRTSEAVVLQAR